MPRRTLLLLAAPFVLCAAGAARAQVSAPCSNRPPSDSAYYEDMKELPEGKYGISYTPDRAQVENPVFVRALTGISGRKQRALKLGCVELENRSGRAVRSFTLRWAVTARGADGEIIEGGEVLTKGTLPAIEVEIPTGVRQKVEVHGAHFADFIRPLTGSGEIKGGFHVSVGLSRVEYTDGTAENLP